MKKYVKCFSNATEAMIWQSNNCDICKGTGCYSKHAIELGFITGHITWKIAYKIGFKSSHSSNVMTEDDYCTLNDQCNMFNKPIAKKRVTKIVKDSNELTLF